MPLDRRKLSIAALVLALASPLPLRAQSAPSSARLTVALSDSRVRVENSTNVPIAVRSIVQVEQQTATGWQRVSLANPLYAINHCADAHTNACISIAPGTILRPVPWTGWSCDAQCPVDCDRNGRLSGTFRYVFTDCADRPIATSAPFTLSARGPSAPALPRLGPGDARPEPSAPAAECRFTERTICTRSRPNRRAWQSSPYTGCPPTIPRDTSEPSAVTEPASFSAARTRALRADEPDACCYVQHNTMVCR